MPANNVTIVGEGEGVVLDGQGAGYWREGISIEEKQNVVIENLEFHNFYVSGIYIWNCSPTIQSNVFYNNHYGVNIVAEDEGAGTLPANPTIINNLILFGLPWIGEGPTIIPPRDIYIRSLGGTSQALIYNNTIHDLNGYGIYFSNDEGTLEPVIKNNILSQCNVGIYASGSPVAPTIDYNNFYNVITPYIDCSGSNTLSVNPRFVSTNAANYDFHLQVESDCIDRGTNIDIIGTDFDNEIRPWPEGGSYDIGADEAIYYTVDFIAGPGGSVSGKVSQKVLKGGNSAAVTANPANGYAFIGWSGDYTGIENPLTVTNVTSDMEIIADFAILHTVTFISGVGGKLIGDLTQEVVHGEDCTEVAVEPYIGYKFTGWSGDYTGIENPLTVTNVTSDMEIIADFAILHAVTFISGVGGKLIGDLTQEVVHGEDCTEVAVEPYIGYKFTGWSGDYTGIENPLTVTNVTSDMEITANFVRLYTVTYTAGTGGSVTGDLTQMVVSGSDCTSVTAVPSEGYLFNNWYVDYTGTENPLTVTDVMSDMEIRANFIRKRYEVIFTAGTGGSLLGDASQTVVHGEDCTAVRAEASEGYEFSGWSGDYTGTENPLTLTNVTSAKTIQANFSQKRYEVIFTTGAGGSLLGDASQTVVHGEDCTAVRAEASEGYEFSGWSGDYTGTENPLTLTNVTSAKTIQANFSQKRYEVIFTAGTGGSLLGDASQTVVHGEDCTAVRAEESEGYEFSGWSGDYTGTENPLTLTNVTSAKTIQANFSQKRYDGDIHGRYGGEFAGRCEPDGGSWRGLHGG